MTSEIMNAVYSIDVPSFFQILVAVYALNMVVGDTSPRRIMRRICQNKDILTVIFLLAISTMIAGITITLIGLSGSALAYLYVFLKKRKEEKQTKLPLKPKERRVRIKKAVAKKDKT